MYQFPAHLDAPDQLMTLGPFHLTLRQSVVLLVGGSLASNLWRMGEDLMSLPSVGFAIRLTLTILPLLVTVLWAFLRLADRYLESWTLLILHYLLLPKHYRWQTIQSREDRMTTRIAGKQPQEEDFL